MYPLIDMQQTGIKIKQLMDERNVSVKQIQEYLNLSCVQSVYHWIDEVCRLNNEDDTCDFEHINTDEDNELLDIMSRPVEMQMWYKYCARKDNYGNSVCDIIKSCYKGRDADVLEEFGKTD